MSDTTVNTYKVETIDVDENFTVHADDFELVGNSIVFYEVDSVANNDKVYGSSNGDSRVCAISEDRVKLVFDEDNVTQEDSE